MRFQSGRGVTLRHAFIEDEEPLTIVPPVTVTVWRDGVAEPFYTGSASAVGDEWSVTLPAPPQGAYKVTWGADGVLDRTAFEVTGGYLFSIPEVRASQADLQDREDFPAAEIRHYREVVEREFETITGRSFVPRTRRIQVELDGSDSVWTGLLDCHSLQGLTGPDGDVTLQGYRIDRSGFLRGVSGLPVGIYDAEVTYGFQDVPEDVKRAGFVRTRYLLAAEDSGIPDRATSYVAAEGGTFSLATPGRNGYQTGIPEVDATLNQYTYAILRDVMGVG